MIDANIAALFYLVAGVLFILALRGLSSPSTARRGNLNAMVGMAIAVVTTLATLWSQGALDAVTLGLIVGGVAFGGVDGTFTVTNSRNNWTGVNQLVWRHVLDVRHRHTVHGVTLHTQHTNTELTSNQLTYQFDTTV
jgi:NAD/NADP transhydrogenase beta subunit